MMLSGTRNMLISGGTFNSSQTIVNTHISDLTPLQRLEQVVAPNAFHNSHEYDQPKCHPGTRIAVIKRIMAWIQSSHQSTEGGPSKPIMWLNGKAGAGKSAIARSIAEKCEAAGLLLATFFFSRSDPTRNNNHPLIPTLAYQMSCLFPEIRTHLEQIISRDPLIFKCSIETQMKSLIIRPMLELAAFKAYILQERLIIIDGLDECDNPKAQENILSAIAHILHQHSLPCVFLIASRPEPHIKNAFDSYKFRDIQIGLELNYSFNPDNDIHLFFQESFNEIKDTHRLRSTIPNPWPTSDNLKTLVCKASGQFIYASVVVKFVKSPRHQPASCLEVILGLHPTNHGNPFAELDALYMQILQSLEDKDTASMFLKALCLSSSFLSRNHINFVSNFLGLDPQIVEVCNSDLLSLLHHFAPPSDYKRYYFVEMAHASFSDFLFDPLRSGCFHVDKGLGHAMMAIQCLKHAAKSREYSEEFKEVLTYSFDHLEFHCRQSSITEDLMDQIWEFSFSAISEECSWFIPYGSLEFIDWMKDQVWEGSQEAYGRLLRQVSQIMQIGLKAYQDPGTTLLIAIAIETLGYSVNQSLLARLLQQESQEYVEGDDLNLFFKISDPSSIIEHCTLDILEKTMDHQKYSVAALMLLEYLCNAPEHSCVLSSHSQLRLHIRQTQPWKWQKMCKPRGLLKREQRRCRNWYQQWEETYCDYLELLSLPKATEKICDIKAYYLALKLVVSCLHKARSSTGDYNPQLVDFMRKHMLSFTAMKFPRRKKEAEDAIARFLAEVDREEHKRRQG